MSVFGINFHSFDFSFNFMHRLVFISNLNIYVVIIYKIHFVDSTKIQSLFSAKPKVLQPIKNPFKNHDLIHKPNNSYMRNSSNHFPVLFLPSACQKFSYSSLVLWTLTAEATNNAMRTLQVPLRPPFHTI